jgi:hypothetical protein
MITIMYRLISHYRVDITLILYMTRMLNISLTVMTLTIT